LQNLICFPEISHQQHIAFHKDIPQTMQIVGYFT